MPYGRAKLIVSEGSVLCQRVAGASRIFIVLYYCSARMAHYMEYSIRIYEIYLKYIAHEDIHVYSIDEVFIDVIAYLNIYSLSARGLVARIIQDVLAQMSIIATASI